MLEQHLDDLPDETLLVAPQAAHQALHRSLLACPIDSAEVRLCEGGVHGLYGRGAQRCIDETQAGMTIADTKMVQPQQLLNVQPWGLSWDPLLHTGFERLAMPEYALLIWCLSRLLIEISSRLTSQPFTKSSGPGRCVRSIRDSHAHAHIRMSRLCCAFVPIIVTLVCCRDGMSAPAASKHPCWRRWSISRSTTPVATR